ncbi:MAG TPA: haloacid dehalogenase type II [Burkholderiaceae bacterium]|nr:haloacid dehalogenase type II [Burkholderiaceae bacterium]
MKVPNRTMHLDALVFDAFGTLFDVRSVDGRCEAFWPGKGTELSALWRTTQLEYSWLRSLMQRYVDFETVTREALGAACAALGLACDDARVAALLQAYRELAPFPEVARVLGRLEGRRRAILSNGSPAMLQAVVRHAAIGPHIDKILSVDSVRVYKPDPRVYQLAVDALEIPRDRIGFVSSNFWDVSGAKAFGFRVFWVNRSGRPADALGVAPDRTLDNLERIFEHIDGAMPEIM